MATRVQTESAQRTSDCVTELLRKQPFFGSLALRLPLRADPSRETLASDGHEIRYSPRWVADTDAHVIETAMARVVMACALKHHTRRGEREPERWQLASQLVTHALLRDSGFTLPPDAEAWDGVSVEQAYERLPEPQEDDSGGDSGSPSVGGDMGAVAAAASGGGDEGASDSPSDSSGEADGETQDGSGEGGDSDAPASHDPSGTGEIMDAGARGDGNAGDGESPVDVTAEEQAWDEAMHQAMNLARAEGKLPGGVEETVRNAHASTLDWRTLLRRHMTDAARRDYSWSFPNRRFIDGGLYLPSIRSEGIDAIAVIIDTSGSLPAQTLADFWAEVREVATEIQPESVHILQVDAALQDAAEYAAGDLPDEIVIKGRGGHRLPAGLRLARRAGHPAQRVPLSHRHAVFQLPRRRTCLSGALGELLGAPRRLEPRALGRAHRHRPRPEGLAVIRAIHGAPAEALRQALEALAGLSFWISWTSDPDLGPEPFVSARCMRDAANALRKAARLLDDAADRADPPPETARRATAPVSDAAPEDTSGGGAGPPAADTQDPWEHRAEAEPSPARTGECRPERAAFAPPIRSSMEIRMNHTAPPPEPLIREIPLSCLALAPENVRKTPRQPIRRGRARGLHQGARPAGEPRRPR